MSVERERPSAERAWYEPSRLLPADAVTARHGVPQLQLAASLMSPELLYFATCG